MSNYISIEPKEFRDPFSGHTTYGVLVCDNEASDYIDWWSELPVTLKGILKQVILDASSVIDDILDFACEEGQGLHVAGIWFSPDEVRECRDAVSECRD